MSNKNTHFVRVASTAEIPAGKMKKVDQGSTAVLVANVSGSFCAVNNKCPHAGGSLAEGTLNGSTVTCPRHKAQFDVRTGEATGKAKIFVLQMMPGNVERYQVKVEGTDISVEMPV